MIEAGKMRLRVEIQARTQARGQSGQQLNEWVVVASRRAEKMPYRGFESFAAQQQFARVHTMWRLRYVAGVVPSMRLVCEEKIYDIITVNDPDNTKTELMINTLERVGETR